MTTKLSKTQLNVLIKNKAHGWECEDNCAMCQYMKRMAFAEGGQSFEELKRLFLEAKASGIIKGDEIDLRLLKFDLEHQ